jgi:hypothetical protein
VRFLAFLKDSKVKAKLFETFPLEISIYLTFKDLYFYPVIVLLIFCSVPEVCDTDKDEEHTVERRLQRRDMPICWLDDAQVVYFHISSKRTRFGEASWWFYMNRYGEMLIVKKNVCSAYFSFKNWRLHEECFPRNQIVDVDAR